MVSAGTSLVPNGSREASAAVTSNHLTDLLDARAAAHADTVALRQKRFGIWHEKTWSDVRDTCRRIGAGLAASGLKPGNRLAILADPSQEAVFMLLGALYAGAVPVIIHPTLPADETRRLFVSSNAAFAYCDTVDRADKILPEPGLAPTGNSSATPKTIVLDSRDAEDRADTGMVGFESLISGEVDPIGEAKAAPGPNAADPNAIAVTTLSSGTTGLPKPIELSHRSLVHAGNALAQQFEISSSDRSLAILPFGHPTELCLSVILPMMIGLQSAFSESARTMQDDMIEIAPTVVVGPPRLWQKLRSDLLLAAHKTGFVRRRLFVGAMGPLDQPAETTRRQSPGVVTRLMVTDALRARSGLGACRIAISTGGPPVASVQRFFSRMGVAVQNAYSVSEAGGIVARLDAPDDAGGGEALRPLPGFDVKVTDDEKIEIGLDDGSIATDDLGRRTDAGVSLLGRFGGGLRDGHAQSDEGMLKADPLIREAVVFVEESGKRIAVVQPDADQLGAWANRHQLLFTDFSSLINLAEVKELLHSVISQSIAEMPAAQRPTEYIVMPHRLGLESGELTPLFAARRPVLSAHLSSLKSRAQPLGS